MFLVVSRFSSPASLIRLGGFSPSPHFTSTILCSTELTSKERGNCNNMMSRKFLKWKSRAESLEAEVTWQQSSRTSPWSVWPPPWRLTQSDSYLELRYLLSLHTCLPMHLSPYALVSLYTCLPTHSSYRQVRVSAGRIFRLSIYLRSSTCQGVILDCHSTRQGSWAVSWTQLTLFSFMIVSLVISQPE